MKGTRKASVRGKTMKVTTRVPVRPLKPAAKASVLNEVKKVVSRSAETKFVTRLAEVNVNHNSAMSAGDLVQLVPEITQGTSDNQRAGDSIKPVTLRVRGLLSMNRLASTENRVLLVRVIIASHKSYKSQPAVATASSIIASSLLKPNYEGATTAPSAFSGNQWELYAPINLDSFRVYYDKIHRIAPVAPDASVEENPASFKRWSTTIKLPATFTYDTFGGDYPTGFAPFMLLGYAYADGHGPDTVNTRIISTTISQLKYKDS